MNEIDFLERLDAPLFSYMQFAGVTARISVNHPQLHRHVSKYFEPYLREPVQPDLSIVGYQGEPEFSPLAIEQAEGQTSTHKLAYYDRGDTRVILKKRSGVVHYVRGVAFYAAGDLLRYPQQLTNLVAQAYAQAYRRNGFLAVHSSGVARAEKGVAFAGNSGSAKSTIALALMHLGHSFVSNDRVFLKRVGDSVEMLGLPKWPRVNPGTMLAIEELRKLLSPEQVARYTALDAGVLWSLEEKHDVPVADLYGKRGLRPSARLERLYILSWRSRNGPFQMRNIPYTEAAALLRPLLKSEVYDPPNLPSPATHQLEHIFEPLTIVQVTGGIDVPGLLSATEAGG